MKITLSQIADKAGVTISTAQRALNGGKGVSSDKRELILDIAKELGYKKNVSPLKKTLRLAVVFPDISFDNRFYTPHLWHGIEHFKDTCSFCDIEIVPLAHKKLEDHINCIQEIIDNKHGHFDGVIARGTMTPKSSEQFKKLQDAGIPAVLVGTDISSGFRLCSVESYSKLTGAMVADLFINFGVLKNRSKAILCGTFIGFNQFYNAQGFERQTWSSGVNVELIKIPEAEDNTATKQNICTILEQNTNVTAIYACSARTTIAAYEAIRSMNMEDSIYLIGSDLFEESIGLLRAGKVSALVHNNPFDLAYTSIETLVTYLTSGKKPEKDTILLNSHIVTRGNLDSFLEKSPSLQQFCDLAQLNRYS